MAVIPSLAGFRKALQGTPMAGEADAIYGVAKRNGVNPAFVAGLAGAESSYGKAGYARGTKNPYGYGVYLNKRYGSYAQATDAMTKSLGGSIYKGAGKRTLQQVMSTYSPSSDGNNVPQHISNITNMGRKTGGDPAQIFVDPSGAAVLGDQVVSESPEETGAQAARADAGEDPAQTMLDTVQTSLLGRQQGQEGSIFKAVVQGVVAAQFAVRDGNESAALNGLTQDRNPTPDPAAAGGEGNNTPVGAAKQHLGVPYSWGGGTPSGPGRGFAQGANTVGFDCSSLMQYAWAKAGVKLPRVTYDQIKVGRAVKTVADAKPGDLMFPSTGHVQMYIGNGQIIEAPQTGGHVQIKPVRSKYIAIRRPG